MALFWKFCTVCRRNIDWHKVRETAIRARLCGWVAYGACVCGMEAENPKEPNYRRRVRRWKAKNETHGRGNSAPVSRGISRKQGVEKP